MACLTGIARAMKSAGMTGGLDYLRANAFIGLLLGTLPLVPPPDGDPGPDAPTDPDPDSGHPDPEPGHPDPEPGHPDPEPGHPDPDSGHPDPDLGHPDPDSGENGLSDSDPGADQGDGADHRGSGPDGPMPPDPAPSDSAPSDAAAPDISPAHDYREPDYQDYEDWDADDGPFAPGPPASWPPLPATLTQQPPFLGQPPPRATQTPAANRAPPASHLWPARPPSGLLELVISWRALTGDPAGPATLSRVGPVTAAQALPLALTAAADPHARWQVILTDPNGYAIAVETVRRRYPPGQARRPAGVTGHVAVTIPAATLDQPTDTSTSTTSTGGGIRAAVLRAARRARAQAQQRAAADASAPGRCAHTDATASYRPSPKLRDYVTARDQTCRNPRCRQPARHADIDHTTAWHKGGPTCKCNLGPYCRVHHQIKQLPGWTLTQPRPGHFQLTTPAGRTYTTTPDPYPD